MKIAAFDGTKIKSCCSYVLEKSLLKGASLVRSNETNILTGVFARRKFLFTSYLIALFGITVFLWIDS